MNHDHNHTKNNTCTHGCCGGDDTSSVLDATPYRCPKHSEVEQDKPGSCPKCGMKLVEAAARAEPNTHAGHGCCH